MRYEWDPRKQAANLKKHGLDFNDARRVIESGQTVTFEDRRADHGEQRFVTLGMLFGDVVFMVTAETDEEIRVSPCARQTSMKSKSSTAIRDDAAIRQADIDAGRLVLRKRAPSGQVVSAKQRVTMYVDADIVTHFKALAGERGYQTLLNNALRQAIKAENIEAVVRKTIRDELRRKALA